MSKNPCRVGLPVPPDPPGGSRTKTKKKLNVVFLYSSNVRKLLAEVSYKIFDKRVKKLVAVTGTNGKSSIADFYFQILKLNFLIIKKI